MKTGFGLISLLITVAIIVLVAMWAIPLYKNVYTKTYTENRGDDTENMTPIDAAKNAQDLMNAQQRNIQRELGQ